MIKFPRKLDKYLVIHMTEGVCLKVDVHEQTGYCLVKEPFLRAQIPSKQGFPCLILNGSTWKDAGLVSAEILNVLKENSNKVEEVME